MRAQFYQFAIILSCTFTAKIKRDHAITISHCTEPWLAVALTIGTGCAASVWHNFITAIKEDLPRQKQLFVNRRREKLLTGAGTC